MPGGSRRGSASHGTAVTTASAGMNWPLAITPVTAPVLHLDGGDVLAREDLPAPVLDVAAGCVGHQLGEAHAGDADVGAVPPRQHAVLKEHQPHVCADAIDGVVEDGQRQQVPQRGDGPLRLPVALQPVAEALSFQGVAVLGAIRAHDAEHRGGSSELLEEA